MSILLIAGSSFMLALSGALIPGPLFAVTVSESVRRGFKAGPLIIAGHALTEAAIILLMISQAAPLLMHEKARFFVGVIGGAVLIIMGFSLLKGAAKAGLDLSNGGKVTGMLPVLTGIIGSITNPYWVIWWITIGLGYLLSSLKYGPAGVLAFFSGHIAADLTWYSIISFAVSRGRKKIGEKGYRFMLYGCGVFLLCFGVWFVTGM